MTQNLELVEKLVEKTGLSYTEAKAALEKTDWDILEALIMLESEGKISKGKTNAYTTNQSQNESEENAQEDEDYRCRHHHHHNHDHRDSERSRETCENFKSTGKSFCEYMKDIFDKGNTNHLVMQRRGRVMLELPVTVFVILLIFCFWVVLPLIIISLFFGCRYSFSGSELGRDKVNNAMGKATDIADDIKREFKSNDNNGNK